MRYVLTGLLLGIIFSIGTVSAQEPPDDQCQNFANRFSQNPDSLAIQELERLRFCIIRALEDREQSLKGELLQGTIIEPQDLPGSSLDTTVPTPPKHLDIH
jgi:hypothetical protein